MTCRIKQIRLRLHTYWCGLKEINIKWKVQHGDMRSLDNITEHQVRFCARIKTENEGISEQPHIYSLNKDCASVFKTMIIFIIVFIQYIPWDMHTVCALLYCDGYVPANSNSYPSESHRKWLRSQEWLSIFQHIFAAFSGLLRRQWWGPGPRLNIKTVLSTYGDFHVKDKTVVRTSYL